MDAGRRAEGEAHDDRRRPGAPPRADPHLELLGEALAKTAAGRGRLVLVEAEAGGGKTALARRFCDDLAGRARVLWGACDALHTPRPLAPLFDIAVAAGGEFGARAAGGAPRDELFGALLAELRRGRQPTVVVLEDVHWADDASLDLLRFLGRRAGGSPTLLIATYRGEEAGPGHPLRVALGDLATSGDVRRLTLPPLSSEAVRALAGAGVRDPDDLHRRTGGNPFYLTEVLALDTGEVPPTVRDAVLARVSRLGAPARRALDAAAVIPNRGETWLVEAAAGVPASGVDACVASGMLVTPEPGVVAFRHELARLAVLEAMPPSERTGLHRRIVELLLLAPEAGPPDDARVAHHAEGAGEADAVLAHAPAAAVRASALGAHREAAAHYALALRFAGALAPAEVAELLERRSYECYLTDQLDEAIAARRAALERWRALGDERREGDNLRWLARLLWFAVRNDEAEDAALQAVAVLEKLPPGPELAMAWSRSPSL